MTGKISRLGPTMAAAALLAACAASVPGESAAYRVGWVHGCDSGLVDAGRIVHAGGAVRDEARYRAEPEYRRGWKEAHQSCAEYGERNPRMGGDF